MIIQVFFNSMIFPCMELFFVTFHYFQSLWEPYFFDLFCLQCVMSQSSSLLIGSYKIITDEYCSFWSLYHTSRSIWRSSGYFFWKKNVKRYMVWMYCFSYTIFILMDLSQGFEVMVLGGFWPREAYCVHWNDESQTILRYEKNVQNVYKRKAKLFFLWYCLLKFPIFLVCNFLKLLGGIEE